MIRHALRLIVSGALTMLAASAAFLGSQAATAQTTASREVVQPLPSGQVQRLNRALKELARRPDRLGPLLEAANASLAVADYDAAIGFFGRAANIAPNDPRVKLGTARTYLRAGRPVAAIPLFAAAQSAGASARDVLPSRALALDMVGEQAAAQTAYTRALELDPDNAEARRRKAISHAISGDADAFQDTLAPLLEKRDFAAFRARAFGLAILGESERAAAIVEAVMPPDLAGRIVPYLAFMPRLTRAQQAAAANLGIFPKAAEIGRESPRIARFARESAVGTDLEPTGQPLGTLVESEAGMIALPPVRPQPGASQLSADSAAGLPVIATSETGVPRSDRERNSVSEAFVDLAAPGALPARPTGQASNEAVDLNAITIVRDAPPRSALPARTPQGDNRQYWVQVATGRDVAALGTDWRRIARQAPELLSGFEPHVAPWGQANRLLAGPLDNEAKARALVNALAAAGIDTFPYSSVGNARIQRLE